MAKETAKERRAREEQERVAANAEQRTEFLKTTPLRLLKLAAAASKFGTVTVHDGNTELADNSSPLLRCVFVFNECDVQYAQTTLTLFSDEWEFESVESTVEQLQEVERVRAARLELARTTYDNLTVEQRIALGLGRRP